MNRLAVLLLALLAGCWTAGPMKDKAEPPPAPGVGVVQSIESTPANPAAGGSAGSSTKRVGVRMADNSLQYFRTRAVGLKIGERVEITDGGELVHPAPWPTSQEMPHEKARPRSRRPRASRRLRH